MRTQQATILKEVTSNLVLSDDQQDLFKVEQAYYEDIKANFFRHISKSNINTFLVDMDPSAINFIRSELDRDVIEHSSVNQLPESKSFSIDLTKDRIGFKSSFKTLQKWEGYVEEVHPGHIVARVTDINGKLLDQEATIPFEEISAEDIELIKPGSIFYWNIGYEVTKGSRRRVSIVRFQRIPAWTKSDVKRVVEKVKTVREEYGW